jgi:hypothetical protein
VNSQEGMELCRDGLKLPERDIEKGLRASADGKLSVRENATQQ